MPKVIITDPKGFYFNRETHPEGAKIELPRGSRLEAALHFKQVKVLKGDETSEEESTAEVKKPRGGRGGKKDEANGDDAGGEDPKKEEQPKE